MHRVIFDEATLKMKEGLDQVADTVKVTMGVKGRNVVLNTNPLGNPLITNDGVTIARALLPFKDNVKNIGGKLIHEIAEKTNDNAGDGTTTTMLLMQAIVDQGMKAIASGADPIELRKGILKATDEVIKYLKTEGIKAKTEDMLAATATISSRDPKLGKLIAKIIVEAGLDGVVTLEDSFEPETTYEKQDGLRLAGGFLHESFINLPQRQQAAFSNVPILITDKPITLGEEMGKIMETVANMGKKEAVVIANDIQGDALATAFLNWQKKAIFILPIRVITYGDAGQGALRDVAAITGANYLDEHEKNIIDVTAEDFGRAGKVVADKRETTVISNEPKHIETRIKQIKAGLDSASEFEKENMQHRIAKLRSSVFTIKVGGKTESERNELKTRVDDAIKAAKAAYEEGVVAGGGSSLYRAACNAKKVDTTTDEGIGRKIVLKACTKPIEQMSENSGVKLDRSDLELVANRKDSAIDFKNGYLVNAFEEGIIDPLKVVLECIENAGKQGGLYLTIDKGVYSVEPPQQEKV